MRCFVTSVLLLFVFSSDTFAQSTAKRIRQPRAVIEAYEVCSRFQRLLAENLDFNTAYEATFTQNKARRREIAISDGEFDGLDLTSVDDATLIRAYKSRMQILYLMLPLASPDNQEEALFFPAEIKQILERKGPPTTEEFQSYAAQLDLDAKRFREHLEGLARQYPSVAERIRKFKRDLSEKVEPPNHVVQPLYAYSRGRVLRKDEPYYSIDGYSVIREGAEMRIVGIRFFTKLF